MVMLSFIIIKKTGIPKALFAVSVIIIIKMNRVADNPSSYSNGILWEYPMNTKSIGKYVSNGKKERENN